MNVIQRAMSGFALGPRSRRFAWWLLPLLAALAAGVVVSQSAPPAAPAIPAVKLASEPLYARGARAKPTLVLALSVEFPTVGAQYVAAPHATEDHTYSPDTTYVGYFDSGSCYEYNNNADPLLKRFDRLDSPKGPRCGGKGFSGNFMNWASSSAVDILRYGLTGGDRVVDTDSLTVLQRAVLPKSGGSFWNGQNFPSKKLLASLAADAVPDSIRPAQATDIYVANCLNRIHFGTQATGDCGAPGANSNLGTPQGLGSNIGPVTPYSGALPADFSSTDCASENGFCAFTGVLEVAYGDKSHNKWIFMPATNGTICSNNMTGTFNDPDSGTFKYCYTRPYNGTWTPPGSSSVLTSDGFFYARVQVCESASGALKDPRTTYCLRYPNGNYKPVGNLQKYSDRIRVAAFGYLNDNTGNPNERYGGVLRVPMKYVGAKDFDANFSLISGVNGKREWDESTGKFIQNPDGATGPNSGADSNWPNKPISGVSNYLNQFGRTGVFGQYKTYDPVGELYYESLRYLQGLPPTDAATAGINDAMRDGFPVDQTWSDPHPAVSGMSDYSCVKNNILGIGDVNTHNDKTIPGNTRTSNDAQRDGDDPANAVNNQPDFTYWTKIVGSFESNHGEEYVDGSGVTRKASNIPANAPYDTALWGMETADIGSDGAAYYMAGMAYWANTHDIRGAQWSEKDKRRPGMRVTTYMLDVNEFAEQTTLEAHKNNQFFLAAKYGGFTDVTGTGNPYLDKKAKDTDADFPQNNVNWESQAHRGDAKNYYLSSSASDVLDALNLIFDNVAREANSIAGGAISTQRLTSDGGFIYQAQFDPAGWSGDLVASKVTVDGVTVNITGTDGVSAPAWSAKAQLNVTSAGSRKIFAGKMTRDKLQTATNFLWDSLGADAQDALRAPPSAASAAVLDPAETGQDRLNFIRGDRSKEAPAGTFRTRSAVLGDIVNSGVAYSPPPTLQSPEAAYVSFYNAYKARKKALYVGANDGMLHAFDADTGNELFGYIPSWVIPRLNQLTSPAYQHQSFVDSSPAVADVKVGTAKDGAWKTVLVGGTGAGGQGVFAIDVTDPGATDMGASKVMWEFTDRDDADMGNVIGRPQLLKFRMTPGDASSDRYFAVVASGVNNYVDDGHFSATGSAALFLLALDKSPDVGWTQGANYFKIVMPAPEATMASGIANFTARLGSGGQVASIYAGDLQGNVWKLDFSQLESSKWTLDKSIDQLSYFKSSGSAIPMYVAKDADGHRQPITMPPALIFGPNRGIIVAFGTGKFLENTDIGGGYGVQSVYAVFDNNTTTADSTTSPSSAIAGRGRLKAGTVDSSKVTVGAFVWGRPSNDSDESSRSGWYFDFANATTTGERQVSGMVVVAGRIAFGSVIPAVNSCDAGNGNLYVLDVLEGSGDSERSPVGILGEPFVVQVGSSINNTTDTTGQRRQVTRYQIIFQGSSGLAAPASQSRTYSSVAGRLNWRELSNYQEIRRAK